MNELDNISITGSRERNHVSDSSQSHKGNFNAEAAVSHFHNMVGLNNVQDIRSLGGL